MQNQKLSAGLAAFIMSIMLTACGGGGGSSTTPVTLQSIAVAPASSAIAPGQTTQMVATGTNSDGTTNVLTSGVTWTSSNTAAATVSQTGLVTGVANGSSTITAISGSITGNTSLAVSSASFTVGGTISGLSVTGLVLSNGSSTTSPAANATTFTLPQSVAAGSGYSVQSTTQPVGLNCQVARGNGVMNVANVTTVGVTCSAIPIAESIQYSFASNNGASPGLFEGGVIQANDGNFYGVTRVGGASNLGTVYKVSAAGVYTLLHSFSGGTGDGANPYGKLVQAMDGNLYGVTYMGGTLNVGTVYKITTAGAETVLHSFGAVATNGTYADGRFPRSGLIQASDGNLYGTTYSGNGPGLNFGYGTVYKITTAGAETVLYSFGTNANDAVHPGSGVIQANDGNLYGTTIDAGAAVGGGAVYKVTLAGAETVLHKFVGTATDGINPFDAGVIQASDGNLYGTTQGGGNNNAGTVYKITLAGVESLLYSFGATPVNGSSADAQQPYGGVIQVSDGNFYGTSHLGGANGSGAVFKISSTGTESVMYSFGANTGDGTLPWAGVILGTDNNFYGTTSLGGAYSAGVLFKLVP